jgi:hypothetical protein
MPDFKEENERSAAVRRREAVAANERKALADMQEHGRIAGEHDPRTTPYEMAKSLHLIGRTAPKQKEAES